MPSDGPDVESQLENSNGTLAECHRQVLRLLIFLTALASTLTLTVCGQGGSETSTAGPTATAIGTVGIATPITTMGPTATPVPTLGGTPVATGVPGGIPQLGVAAIQKYNCGACHLIPGIPGAVGAIGPPLAGFANRPLIAGQIPNTPSNLIRWLQNPRAVIANAPMPDLGVRCARHRCLSVHLDGADAGYHECCSNSHKHINGHRGHAHSST